MSNLYKSINKNDITVKTGTKKGHKESCKNFIFLKTYMDACLMYAVIRK